MTDLTPNQVGSTNDPVNVSILDVNAFENARHIKEVTSTLIFEPSTHNFHPDGLFSEEIFGKISSPERMRLFGYIDLHTTIFAPKYFEEISKLSSLYVGIMSGKMYAYFDEVIKDFVLCTNPDNEPNADTGYSFFMSRFKEINFRRTGSSRREVAVEMLEQYRDNRSLYTSYPVIPAGLRDIRNDSSSRLVQDEINTLYRSAMMCARAIPKGTRSTIYDSVRWQLQGKIQEIYEYIKNMVAGKRGYLQGNYARRNVAFGTRNVISAATMMAATPDSPQFLKCDEIGVGVYQTIKGTQPLTVFYYNTLFAKPVFGTESTVQVPLINLKTKTLEHVEIPLKERWRFTTSDGIESLINRFDNHTLRFDPVTVTCNDGQQRALMLVYDDGDEIYLCRSKVDLQQQLKRPVVDARLRPLTWMEMFYIIAYNATLGRHGNATRYPVINGVGDLPLKIHVIATTPSRIVTMHSTFGMDTGGLLLPEYPIMNKPSFDIMVIHPSLLQGFGADKARNLCFLRVTGLSA